jgi:hypothetical protein
MGLVSDQICSTLQALLSPSYAEKTPDRGNIEIWVSLTGRTREDPHAIVRIVKDI